MANSWFLVKTSHRYCSGARAEFNALALAVAAVALAVAAVALAVAVTIGAPGQFSLCLYILVRCLNTFLQDAHV